MLKILVELPQHTFLFKGQEKNVLHEICLDLGYLGHTMMLASCVG